MNNIILLGIVSFINDTASKMIVPVLPLFIEQIGGNGLAVGLVSGIGDSVASFLKVISGYWSDKTGKRKPFVLSGYATSALGKLLLFFAQSWPFVLVLRILERLGKGLRSAPRDSMIAATAAESSRGKAFGIHRAFDSAGAVIGSLLVLGLVWLAKLELRTVFLIAGLISFLSVIPVLFTRETGKTTAASKTKLSVAFNQLPAKLKLFMAIATIFAVGNYGYMFFVLKAKQAFTGADAFVIPVALYIVYQFVYMALAIPFGSLADKIGKNRVLFFGYASYILVSIGFMYASNLTAFLILFVLYGVMFALIESNERAYVSDLARSDIRGTALGTFFTLTSLAALPAGIVAGLLYDMNPDYTFFYGLATGAIASILMLVHVQKYGQKQA